MQHKIITAIIFSILLFADFQLRAQESTAPNISYTSAPKRYEIAEIKVVGVQNYDPEVLVNLSGLRVGQLITVPGDEVTQSLNKYWNHGLFSNVKFTASKIDGKYIYLEIQLTERPRLSEINFYGLKKGEIETISEKAIMMKGSQVTPHLISRAEKYIKDYFIEKGFYNTEVYVIQKDDTTKVNQVILDITVDKKDKVKVNSITFEGNENLSDYELNSVMKKTNAKGKIYNFFSTKKFVKELYAKDLTAIVDKYNEEGYRDVYIVTDSIAKNEDNTVDISIKINEGRKYYYGNITWIGNSIYSSEFLGSELAINKGEIYNQIKLNKRLNEDEDAVSNWYMDRGYLFSNITPVEINVYGDTIDVEMRIYEGSPATINSIIIKGNDKTHEHVVRREIRTKPGQLFSKSELIRTIRELAQLGHFDPEQISPDVKPNPEDGTVNVTYNLVEKANDQIELSGGYGAGMFVGSLGLKFTNFSVRNFFNGEAWRPLPMGDGQTLSLRAQTNGKYYQSYSASFTEPWLGGKKPNSLTLSFYYSKQTDVSSSYYHPQAGIDYSNRLSDDKFMKIIGGSVGFGKRLTWPDDYFSIFTQVNLQHYILQDWNYFIMNNGSANVLSFDVVLSRNSTDNPLYTRNGSAFSVGLSFTPPYSSFDNKDYETLYANSILTGEANKPIVDASMQELYQNIEYHKWTFKAQVFKPLDKAQKLVGMARFDAGFLGYYTKSARSPFEKFVVGGDGMSGFSMMGSETIGARGYENSSMTPYDEKGSLDGNLYTKMTLELRYPIVLEPSATVYALTFLESARAWSDFSEYNPFEMYRAAGVGVRIFLPIFGLMGIDYGYGFDDINGRNNVNGSQFHFVIGQSF